MPGQPISPYNATVLTRRDLTADLSVVRIHPDSGILAPFEPGQFATVGLPPAHGRDVASPQQAAQVPERPKLIRRAYSIASPPGLDYLELYVVLVEAGKLTPKLWGVGAGQRLFLDPAIKGEFTLEGVPTGKTLVMVSTGTGLAPYMSMLRAYRGRQPQRWNRFVVVHGVRHVRELGYRDELEEAAATDPSVVYVPCVTRPQPDDHWTGVHGRVHAALDPGRFAELTGGALTPETCEVFLCGNPAMIDTVEQSLHGLGFVTATRKQPGNIHFERYW